MKSGRFVCEDIKKVVVLQFSLEEYSYNSDRSKRQSQYSCIVAGRLQIGVECI